MSVPEISEVASDVFAWARKQDFAGHDPHDLLNAPLLARLRNPAARLVAVQAGRRSPIDLHSLLRVPRSENPKALALFLMGLLRARDKVQDNWKQDASSIVDRLARSVQPSGGWGYPFPWQSRTHFLAPNMPNIVTTSFAGMSLVESQLLGLLPDVTKQIERAAEYIVHGIPRIEESGIAFGYAEGSPQIVLNASLLGAEFLARSSPLLGRGEYLDLARRAAQFVVSYQRPDGSWPYGLEPSQSWIDSFHTGFVVLSLKAIAEAAGDDTLRESALRGFQYYRKTFIEPDFAVRYFPNRRYPIDAHALGQAMVTLSEFGDHVAARNVACWSCEHMLSPQGYFYYQRHRLFTNRIPYMRWSNAWMFRGLCEVLANE
jgi:hypothetical protein